MARPIRKVVKFTQVHYIVYNTTLKAVENKIDLLAGVFKSDKSMLKALKKNIDNNIYKLIDVITTDVIFQKREISMEDFLKYSTEVEVVNNEEN